MPSLPDCCPGVFSEEAMDDSVVQVWARSISRISPSSGDMNILLRPRTSAVSVAYRILIQGPKGP
jgi:hypothetical protein